MGEKLSRDVRGRTTGGKERKEWQRKKESGLLLRSPKELFSYSASHRDLQLSPQVPRTNSAN